MYRLTEEGRHYVKKGLPEVNLIERIEDGISVTDASKYVENFAIALAWAKKNNWIRVEAGKIFILTKPRKFEHQSLLEEVGKGKKIDAALAQELMRRGLIEEDRLDERKRAEEILKHGKELGEIPAELIKTGRWREAKFKPYNVEATGKRLDVGKRQPYRKFLCELKKKLMIIGFEEMTGPSIETEFWNFDALYQPQNHAARDWTDTYQLKEPKKGELPVVWKKVAVAHENGGNTGSVGWKYKWDPEIAKRLLPRAHGTCISARTLAAGPKIPGKYFAVVRCFRPDVLDATHLIEFNQVEGIIIDPSLNFKSLLGILEIFAKEIAGATDVKFFPDYYPFTEPSVQMSAKHPKLGWVEFGGAGIFREELTKPLGVDVPVIAWGIGVDRLAMFKLGIKDIRELFSNDIRWLKESVVI